MLLTLKVIERLHTFAHDLSELSSEISVFLGDSFSEHTKGIAYKVTPEMAKVAIEKFQSQPDIRSVEWDKTARSVIVLVNLRDYLGRN